MARSNSKHTIFPFPPEINRDAFGNWLSGFVDGEGCFYLGLERKTQPKATFQIGLRADDRPILELIRSFWWCGTLYLGPPQKNTLWGRACTYHACVITDFIETIIPHFEKHPLRSKKQKDFLVWKKAVQFMWQTYPGKSRCVSGKPRGTIYWTEGKKEEFLRFVCSLREGRKFSNEDQACGT